MGVYKVHLYDHPALGTESQGKAPKEVPLGHAFPLNAKHRVLKPVPFGLARVGLGKG
jgi:hypothetical protein